MALGVGCVVWFFYVSVYCQVQLKAFRFQVKISVSFNQNITRWREVL